MKFFTLHLGDASSSPTETVGFPVAQIGGDYILDDQFLPRFSINSVIDFERLITLEGIIRCGDHTIMPHLDGDGNGVCILIQVRMGGEGSGKPWMVNSPRFEPLIMGGEDLNKSLVFYLFPGQHIFLELGNNRYIVYCEKLEGEERLSTMKWHKVVESESPGILRYLFLRLKESLGFAY